MSQEFKLSLFYSKREVAFSILILFVVFLSSLFFEYSKYKELTYDKFFLSKATVLNHYYKKNKNGKKYSILKLKSEDGFDFITTSWQKDLEDLKDKQISFILITEKIDFLGYLRGFFAPTFDIEILDSNITLKSKIANFITSQHNNKLTKELFLALFLAKPISKKLRAKIQNLGISHLVAISGFHLGVLFSMIYYILSKFYIFFQDRFFPYRNRKFDLSILIIPILFSYLYLLDFTPSLLRSFVMMIFGFFLYTRNIKIVSFEMLFFVALAILAIFPKLLFSISFWFSISGVFYIYLFLHYFKNLKNWQIFILLNFWVYLAMMPIVHFVFFQFSFYQFLSPIISMIFVLFYPLELLLHILNLGNMLDNYILKLLSIKEQFLTIKTPLWFLVLYILSSMMGSIIKISKR